VKGPSHETPFAVGRGRRDGRTPGRGLAPHRAGRTGGRAWGVLFVLCGAIFLEGIDDRPVGWLAAYKAPVKAAHLANDPHLEGNA
jgi:hypothetical protein